MGVEIDIMTLVKQLGCKHISRAEVNRLTTHVLPNIKNCQNIVWESRPTLSVTQVRTSMREVILFLFKQYDVLPFRYIMENFIQVFNSCFTKEKPYALHKYAFQELQVVELRTQTAEELAAKLKLAVVTQDEVFLEDRKFKVQFSYNFGHGTPGAVDFKQLNGYIDYLKHLCLSLVLKDKEMIEK